jgi:hypothetical protein
MKSRIFAVTAALVMIGVTTVAAGNPDEAAPSAASNQPSAVAATAGQPHVEFPELNFEFKPVVDGTTITHEFPVKNTGQGPLAIRKVKTG